VERIKKVLHNPPAPARQPTYDEIFVKSARMLTADEAAQLWKRCPEAPRPPLQRRPSAPPLSPIPAFDSDPGRQAFDDFEAADPSHTSDLLLVAKHIERAIIDHLCEINCKGRVFYSALLAMASLRDLFKAKLSAEHQAVLQELLDGEISALDAAHNLGVIGWPERWSRL